MTNRTAFFMLANVWVLPALISFTPIFLGWYTTNEHLKYMRDHPEMCMFVVNKTYAIISSSVSFWIPGIVMITMYFRIYKYKSENYFFFLKIFKIFSILLNKSIKT